MTDTFHFYSDRLAKVYVRAHVILVSGLPPSPSGPFDNNNGKAWFSMQSSYSRTGANVLALDLLF